MDNTRGLWRGKGTSTASPMDELRIGGLVIGYYCPVSHLREFENEHMIIDAEYPQGISYVVDPETLGECTGLRDKNGTLIFEGDILRIPDCHFPIVVYWSPVEARFFVDDITDDFLVMDISDIAVGEIIGNVHDNPELLERR